MHQASGNPDEAGGSTLSSAERGRRLRFATSLSSAHEGLTFTVRIIARWHYREARKTDREIVLAQLRLAIRTEANKVTRSHSVLNPQAAHDALITQLGQWQQVANTRSLRWRLIVTKVKVGNKERDRAVDHQLALADEHARVERSHTRIVALRKIMADRGSLYAWWLQHVPLAEPPSADLITALEKLAKDISALPPPQGATPEPRLAELAGWFWAKLTTAQRDVVLNQISHLAEWLDIPEVAHQLAAFRAEDPAGHILGNGADPNPSVRPPAAPIGEHHSKA